MIKQLQYNHKVIQKRPMVTPTKVQASELRVKEGMVEVRNIFQRVDHAFKKRKEENEVLAQEITDLENNILYLEKQTVDQAQSTTSINIALSSVQLSVNRSMSGNRDINERIHDLQLLVDSFNDAKQRVDGALSLLTASQKFWIQERADITAHLSCGTAQSEAYRLQCEQLSTTLFQRSTEIDNMEDDSKNKGDKLNEVRDQEKLTDEALLSSFSAIADLRNRKETTCKLLAEVETSIARSDIRLTEIWESKEKLQTAAATHYSAFATQMELRQDEIIVAEAENSRLISTIKEQKENLVNMQSNHSKTKMTVEQLATQISIMEEHIKEDNCRLQGKVELADKLKVSVVEAKEELSASQSTAREIDAENKIQFELTCTRINELRDLHQRHSSITIAVNEDNKILNSILEKLKVECKDKRGDLLTLNNLLIQHRIEAELEAQSVQLRTEEVKRQQEELHSKSINLREQQDDIARVKQAMITNEYEELRRQELIAQITVGKLKLHELREKNSQLVQDQQRAVEDIASAKSAIIAAKKEHKKKKGAYVRDAAAAKQSAEFHAEIDHEAQALCHEMKAKHAQQILEINQCREKLAKGFPGIYGEDVETQKKEQKQEGLRDSILQDKQSFLVTAQEKASSISNEHNDESDAFPFVALTENLEKSAIDTTRMAPPPMKEPSLAAVATPKTSSGKPERQITPPQSGLSQWELSEPAPASTLPPLPRTYARNRDTSDPLVSKEENSTFPTLSVSAKKHKRHRSNKQRKSPPHSDTSSFNLLQPHPTMGTTKVSSSQTACPVLFTPHVPIRTPAADDKIVHVLQIVEPRSSLDQVIKPCGDALNFRSHHKELVSRPRYSVSNLSGTSQKRAANKQAHHAHEETAINNGNNSAHSHAFCKASQNDGKPTVSNAAKSISVENKRLPFPKMLTDRVPTKQPEVKISQEGTARRGGKLVALAGNWFSEDAPF